MLKTHAKVWLWIVFIVNILGALAYLRLLTEYPILGFSSVMSLLVAAAIGILLFKRMKLGFYIFCGLSVIIFFLNVYRHANFILALFGMLASPIITYLFIKSSWDFLS